MSVISQTRKCNGSTDECKQYEVASSEKDTRITTRVGRIEIHSMIFQDDIAALTNSIVEAMKNQAMMESFQHEGCNFMKKKVKWL